MHFIFTVSQGTLNMYDPYYPTRLDLRSHRSSAGITQREAADLIYTPFRTYQDWEGGIGVMHPAIYETFQRKIEEIKCHSKK